MSVVKFDVIELALVHYEVYSVMEGWGLGCVARDYVKRSSL